MRRKRDSKGINRVSGKEVYGKIGIKKSENKMSETARNIWGYPDDLKGLRK